MTDQQTTADRQNRTVERLALSINEFCERTGISRATIYRLAARGDVVLRKIGYRTLVPISEVERLLGVPVTGPGADQ